MVPCVAYVLGYPLSGGGVEFTFNVNVLLSLELNSWLIYYLRLYSIWVTGDVYNSGMELILDNLRISTDDTMELILDNHVSTQHV